MILDRIKKCYNINPLPRWSLEHRLFRETLRPSTSEIVPSVDSSKSLGLRYLQVLSLSTNPERSYIAITTTYPPSQTRAGTPATLSSGGGGGESNGEPALVIAIPSGSQSEEFIQLMISRFGPLWTQRQTLHVSNGQAFEAGDLRVKIGEVRQGQGGAQQGKGVIVEIEWAGGDEYHLSTAEGVIGAFWKKIDIKGARECMRVPGVEQDFSNVRQWCEALRLR